MSGVRLKASEMFWFAEESIELLEPLMPLGAKSLKAWRCWKLHVKIIKMVVQVPARMPTPQIVCIAHCLLAPHNVCSCEYHKYIYQLHVVLCRSRLLLLIFASWTFSLLVTRNLLERCVPTLVLTLRTNIFSSLVYD